METEEQMEMAFMQDDGMDVDPVSGNEVPQAQWLTRYVMTSQRNLVKAST